MTNFYDDDFIGHPFTPKKDDPDTCGWRAKTGMVCGCEAKHDWHLMFGRTIEKKPISSSQCQPSDAEFQAALSGFQSSKRWGADDEEAILVALRSAEVIRRFKE